MVKAQVSPGADLHPDARLIVALETGRDPQTLLVYLDARPRHTHVRDPGAIRGLWEAWNGSTGQHLTTRVPAEAICECSEGR